MRISMETTPPEKLALADTVTLQVLQYRARGGSITQCPPCRHSKVLRCSAAPQHGDYATGALTSTPARLQSPQEVLQHEKELERIKDKANDAARQAYSDAREAGKSVRNAKAAASKARKACSAVLRRAAKELQRL